MKSARFVVLLCLATALTCAPEKEHDRERAKTLSQELEAAPIGTATIAAPLYRRSNHVVGDAAYFYVQQFESISNGLLSYPPVLGGSMSASTVERSLQNRISDVLSVMDFGAVGDGATDDSAALNAAFTQAALTSGTLLIIPPATYGIKSTLTIGNNFSILAGKYVTILALTGMTAMANVGTAGSTDAQTGYKGSMTGLSWNCNSLSTDGIHLGSVSPVTNVYANGYRFGSDKVLNCPGSGVTVGGNAWMDEFDGLVAMRNGNGIHLMPGPTGGANIAFYSSNFSDNAVGLNIAPIPNIAGSESAVYVYGSSFGDNTSWAIRNGDTTLDASLYAAQLFSCFGCLIEQPTNWLSNDGMASFYGSYFQNGSGSGTLGWLIQNGGVLNINGGRVSNGGKGATFRPGDAKVTTQQVVGM